MAKAHRTFRNNPAIHRSDGLTEIELTHNKIALINTFNYAKTLGYGWYATMVNKGNWYAQAVIRSERTKSGKTTIMMHRLFLPDVPLIDHYNRNGLDNTMINLRAATKAQNMFNCKKYSRSRHNPNGTTSKYVGVSYCSSRGDWTAAIRHEGKILNLGQRKTEEEAYALRLAAEKKYYPDFERYPDHLFTGHDTDGKRTDLAVTSANDSHLIELGVALERQRSLEIITTAIERYPDSRSILESIELRIKNPAGASMINVPSASVDTWERNGKISR
jgi:hypothetical protein